jgi:dihydrofolate reductase
MKLFGFPTEEIMIIGGASIYEQFLPHADKLYITRVPGPNVLSSSNTKQQETFFPKVDWSQWEEKEQKKVPSKNGDITFSVFFKNI